MAKKTGGKIMNLVRFTNPVVKRNFTDELFDSFFSNELMNSFEHKAFPKANVIEGKDSYRIELLAPGFEKEDIEVKLHQDVLTLKGEQEYELSEDDRYASREFGACNFLRRFKLPQTVKAESISAEMKSGRLIVNIPKKEESIDNGPIDIDIL
jgi:HSP20 family protein